MYTCPQYAKQGTELVLTRAAIEATVRDLAVARDAGDVAATAVAGGGRRRLQADGGSLHPPTLEEMLVSGSDASALLAKVFVTTQRPLTVAPTAFSKVDHGDGDGSGHRRNLQLGGDRLRVTVDSHAATAADGAEGVRALARRLHGTVVE
jgi:hypothetical protein